MNRVEFMNRLSELLSDVNETEREEALKYYRDYFEDAGSWNEQNVISELVSPEQVAKTIKESLLSEDNYKYDENLAKMPVDAAPEAANNKAEENITDNPAPDVIEKEKSSNSLSTGMVVVIVLLCILLFPVAVGAGGSVLSFVITLFVLWIVLSLLIAVCPFVFTVAGVTAIVSGVIKYASEAAIGVLLVGSGLVGIGLGLVGYVVLWSYFFKLMPKLFKWFFGLFKKGGKKQ